MLNIRTHPAFCFIVFLTNSFEYEGIWCIPLVPVLKYVKFGVRSITEESELYTLL